MTDRFACRSAVTCSTGPSINCRAASTVSDFLPTNDLSLPRPVEVTTSGTSVPSPSDGILPLPTATHVSFMHDSAVSEGTTNAPS